MQLSTSLFTALHQAAFLGHLEVVEVLLQAGAKRGAKNQKGATPLQNATTPWTPEIEGLIRYLGEVLAVDYDLDDIRRNRTEVAARLREAHVHHRAGTICRRE